MSSEPGHHSRVVTGVTAVLVVFTVGLHLAPPGWSATHDTAVAAARVHAVPTSAPTQLARPRVAASTASSSPSTGTPTSSPPTPVPTDSAGAGPLPTYTTIPPSETLPAGVISQNVGVRAGGYDRVFTTVAPASGSAGLPMIVFLSGSSAPPGSEVARDELLSQVAAGQLSVVYPVALDYHWNIDGVCCTINAEPKTDDAAFVRAVTARATALLRPDTRRIYLAGYSAGGRLAWQLACTDGAPFAAVATYGAVPELPCASTGTPLPVLIGVGLADPDEPVTGKAADAQGVHPAAAVNVATWRARDGCPSTSTTTTVGGQIQEQTWSGCTSGAVTYARWRTGDHLLPHPPAFAAAVSFGTVAWNFLQSFRRA